MSETTTRTQQLNRAIMEKEGKYLTFALGQEEYGLEILKVREIIGYMEITAVPQTPHYVKGVINLRGQVIPVIDLRAKFGMETTERTEETCIIVVEISQGDRNFSTGIVVDHVQEVLDIAGEDIEESPQFGSAVNTDFILGMGKIGDTVKILLDIDKVLAGDDFGSFGGSANEFIKEEIPLTDEEDKQKTSASAEPLAQTSPAKDE
jgi:purine-binding chemotaxis protein CheW